MRKFCLIFILTSVLLCAFGAVALADLPPSERSGYVAVDENGTAVNIHSGYTVNSDACASCHSAHQAYNDPNLADGKKGGNMFLLYEASATCMTCHDGTVTETYDVKAGHIGDAVDAAGNPALSKAGLFAVQNAGSAAAVTALSASEHPAFSNRNMVNVPGGKKTAGADVNGAWLASDTLSCASCHEPHGAGGNPRLLNPNPNLVMSQGTSAAGVKNAKLVDFSVTPYNADTKYYFSAIASIAQTTNALDTPITIAAATTTGKRPLLGATKGGSVSGITLKNGVGGSTLTLDTAYKFGYDTGKDANGYKTISAWVKFPTQPGIGIITVDYTPVLEVQMAIANKLTANETIKYGAGMTQFCSACHYDYALSKGVLGTYNGLAHHTGSRYNNYFIQLGNYPVAAGNLDADGFDIKGNSSGSCLTCHFGHGVDATRWGAAGDAIVANPTDPNGQNPVYQDPKKGYGSLLAFYSALNSGDPNPLSKLTKEAAASSQLKRLPNFGTCITCHAQQKASYSN